MVELIIVVALLVIGFYLVNRMRMPEPLPIVFNVVLAVVLLIYILRVAGIVSGPYRW